MSNRLRVLVIDDSALYRQMIRNVFQGIPSIEVIGVAKGGREGLEKIQSLKPDVITLDYEMPDLNGIGVLKGMKRRGHHPKAIMVSSYTEEGAKVTTDALLEGAFDFVKKPSGRDPAKNRDELRVALLERLAPIADAHSSPSQPVLDPRATSTSSDLKSAKTCQSVVIGSSTGGPVALREVLTLLPGDLRMPVIVVQHMPTKFTAPLARRLNEACDLEVVETAPGMKIRPGGVYIAAGGSHTKLVRRASQVVVQLTDDPPENSCRPAVDYTMRSATKVFDGHVCGVILTGMGRDGTKGCQILKDENGTVMAQHPKDCTVYGMPKSVIEAGLANQVLSLKEIAMAIAALK